MRFFMKSLQVENCRLIKETCLELDPRVTILIGPTGSGKSTLIEALKWAQELIVGCAPSLDSNRSLYWNKAHPLTVTLTASSARNPDSRSTLCRYSVSWSDVAGYVSHFESSRKKFELIHGFEAWVHGWRFYAPMGRNLKAYLSGSWDKERIQNFRELVKTFIAYGMAHLQFPKFEISDASSQDELRLICYPDEHKPGSISIPLEKAPDGLIRFMMLVAALSDPEATFVVFEDPEVGIDPRLGDFIAEVVMSSVRKSSKLQVLIVTHSPEFASLWGLRRIRIMNRGRVEPVPKHIVKASRERGLSFHEAWMFDMVVY